MFCRNGEERENNNVGNERDNDPFRIVCLCLQMPKNQHRAEIRDRSNGRDGRLKALQDSFIIVESSLEVRSGSEEHVPDE